MLLQMDPKHLFFDRRFTGYCVFCGGEPETQDHVPSKVFLDDPVPRNLATVEACLKCNNGFSLDEEYLSCFLEAVVCGSIEADKIRREKVKKAFSRKPNLAQRILGSQVIDLFDQMSWHPEEERVKRIITKLAKGHAAHELSLPQIEEPESISFFPLQLLDEKQRNAFENIDYGPLFPEIGSRAFLRVLGATPFENEPGPWISVQEGRYRYAAIQDGSGVLVRIVLSEYLACEVFWE